MRKLLTSDNSLKIISVLIAIIIWIYIAIVMDPAIEVTIRDLPIQFVGQEMLGERDLSIISESATTVTVKLKGSRKKMGNYDMRTIIPKVDVSEAKKGINSLPVDIVVPFEHHEISSQSHYSIDVNVESMVEKTIAIDVKKVGSVAEGYATDTIVAEPSEVTVRGAESAVIQISKAAVSLDINNADVDVDAELPIIFYNESKEEISSLDAIMQRVTPSVSTVKVHCPVLKTREIPVKADFGSQILPEGFNYKINPSDLLVYGQDTSVTEIETEIVPLAKLLENDKVKVKLNIPQNVKILNNVSEVEVSIDKD